MNLRLYVESVQTVPKLIHFSLEGIIFVAWMTCSPDLFRSMTAELGKVLPGMERKCLQSLWFFFLNCVPKLCFAISLVFMPPFSRNLFLDSSIH